MGNTPSSEQPRRVAQRKLAKPRLHNRTDSFTGGDSPIRDINTSTASPARTRYSNSPYAGPPSPTGPARTDSAAGPPIDYGVIDDEPPPAWDLGSRPGSQRLSKWRRPSYGSTTRMRPNLLPSLNTAPDGLGVSHARTTPEHSPRSPPSNDGAVDDHRASTMYEYSGQWPIPTGDFSIISPISPTTLPPGDDPYVTDTYQQQQHNVAADGPLARSQSDLSMYAPTRRRSLIQVPGVATRSEPRYPPLHVHSVGSNASYRQSFPAASVVPTPDDTDDDIDSGRNSFESYRRRHLSMPLPPSLDLDGVERAGTPPNIEFRQLGAIKFGSLHITNGTPSSTPGPLEEEFRTAHASPVSPPAETTSTPSYFVSMDKEPSQSATADAKQSQAQSGSAAGATLSATNTSDNRHSESPTPQATPASDLDRSDSGAGSASSSGASSDPATADSGYGSMLSLKSFFGSRKSTKHSKSAASPAVTPGLMETPTPTLPQDQAERPQLKQYGAYSTPGSKQDSQATSTTGCDNASPTKTDDKDQGLFMSRRRNLLGSFKAKKAQLTTPTAKFRHARGSSNPEGAAPLTRTADTNKKPGSPTGGSASHSFNNSNNKARRRLSLSSRRRSLPNMNPDKKAEADTDVPSMPSNAAEKVQQLSNGGKSNNGNDAGHSPSRPRSFFRSAGSSTLLSVPMPGDATLQNPRLQAPSTSGHLSRSLSVMTPSKSYTTHGQRKSILRRSQTAASMTPKDDGNNGIGEDDLLSDSYDLGLDVEAASVSNIRRSMGNSAFDQAFTAMSRAQAQNMRDPAVEEALRRGPPQIPGNSSGPGMDRHQYPRLRTRSSAPDFLETVSEPADEPGSVDCYSQKKPKTPPPVSIRTRGSKKKKRPRPPHAASHGSRAHYAAEDGPTSGYYQQHRMRSSSTPRAADPVWVNQLATAAAARTGELGAGYTPMPRPVYPVSPLNAPSGTGHHYYPYPSRPRSTRGNNTGNLGRSRSKSSSTTSGTSASASTGTSTGTSTSATSTSTSIGGRGSERPSYRAFQDGMPGMAVGVPVRS